MMPRQFPMFYHIDYLKFVGAFSHSKICIYFTRIHHVILVWYIVVCIGVLYAKSIERWGIIYLITQTMMELLSIHLRFKRLNLIWIRSPHRQQNLLQMMMKKIICRSNLYRIFPLIVSMSRRVSLFLLFYWASKI